MDKISVNDLAFYGRHGALPEEQVLGQTYRVSLEFELNTQPAADRDDLDKTVDYRDAISLVREIIHGPPVRLIETLANRIATGLLERLPAAHAATVRLTKVRPPAGENIGDVTIEIRRERER